MSPELGAWSLNHWTAREVHRAHDLNQEAKLSQGHMAAEGHRETELKSCFTPRPELIPRPEQCTGAADISMCCTQSLLQKCEHSSRFPQRFEHLLCTRHCCLSWGEVVNKIKSSFS